MTLFALTDYDENLIHVGSEKDCQEVAENPCFSAGTTLFINQVSPEDLLFKLADKYWTMEQDNDGQILYYTGIIKE